MTPIPVRRLLLGACLLTVACGGRDAGPGSFVTPTPAPFQVLKTVRVADAPVNVVADPIRGRAYVLNLAAESLMVLDGAVGTVISTRDPLRGPTDIAVDLDLRRLYVVSARERRIVAIDLDSFEIVASRVLSRLQAANVAVDPVAHQVYVTHPDQAVVTRLDGLTLWEQSIFPVEQGPTRVAVDPATHRAYVTKVDGGSVDVVEDDHVVATVPIGPAPEGIAVDPVAHFGYVSIPSSNYVSRLDGNANAFAAALSVGNAPGLPAIDATTRTLYVPIAGEDTLAMIDLPSNLPVATVPVGRHPAAAAVDTAAHRVYVVNRSDNTVSIVDGVR